MQCVLGGELVNGDGAGLAEAGCSDDGLAFLGRVPGAVEEDDVAGLGEREISSLYFSGDISAGRDQQRIIGTFQRRPGQTMVITVESGSTGRPGCEGWAGGLYMITRTVTSRVCYRRRRSRMAPDPYTRSSTPTAVAEMT